MTPRLKSLELQGYKTFASRTYFEYPADITTIVGPNGSGKSNIADSIRWVLGEQAYSLLRGRKTEDMIFAGSDQRPRASMASATITFNNEDGWLPIDFAEVSVTRRAYRDGQNEYLLNGQRVRLKEISELLAKSGLAERTYTIIGQGLVDAALSLKPEERRRFFEEAAGIGLYRGRREEALGRLDNTRRNLERVNDILNELQPRLASLEKQVHKVREYERIQADLRILMREWYGYHWHKIQEELALKRGVLHVQEEKLKQARQRLEEVEGQLGIQRGNLQALRSDLNQWHIESAEFHRQREKISRNMAVLEERRRALLDQQQSLQSDLARLEAEQSGLRERLEAFLEDRKRLQGELQEAQNQAEAARRNLRQRQHEREQNEKTLQEARRGLVTSETRQVQLNARQEELLSRKEALIESEQALKKRIAEGESKVLEARQNLEQANQQKEEAGQAYKKIQEELEGLRGRLKALEDSQKSAESEKARLAAERTRLQAQLEVLEQAERSFSGLNKGARFILEASREGKLRGNYQALSSLIEIPERFEQALAAALGEYLDSVVLEAASDAEDALVLLSRGENGRVVLIPRPQQTGKQDLKPMAGDGSLGLLIDHLETSEEMQPLLRSLIGQVVVVEDRQTAQRFRSSLPETARVVTLMGDVFYGNGAIVAGQDGRKGVVARPRQKKELQTLIAEIEAQVSKAEQKTSQVRKDLEAGRRSEAEMEERLKESGKAQNRALETFRQASLDLERAAQNHEWQRGQLNQLEEQVAAADNDIQKIYPELEEIKAKIEAGQQKIRDQRRTLNNLPLEEFQAQVAHWETNLAVSGRALKDFDVRMQEYQSAIANNQQLLQTLKERLEGAMTSLADLEKEKSDQQIQESRLNDAIEELQNKIGPAEKELESQDAQYAASLEKQTTIQQALMVAERNTAQAQLELTRSREAMENLRRRIEEDFGLVAFEYTTSISGPKPLPLGEMVEQLPLVKEITPEIEETINRQRTQLRRMGPVNPEAESEYQAVQERFDFLTSQVEDLQKADADLRKVIAELDELMKTEFHKTFNAVAEQFGHMFTRLFGGGTARLILSDEDNPTETGIDIEARLPGRRDQGLSLLSGGERSLTAVALIFSLLKVSPTPFCVLDEVDAMLDEANVGRFCELLRELSRVTQFVVITHNRNTVQTGDVIYGVTMGRDSASQVISLRIDEISDEMMR